MIRSTMALRNTLRQPRRTLLLGGAIAFGVMVICLVSGFTSGMEEAIQNNVTLYSGGHILVSGMSFGGFGRMQNKISDAALAEKVKEIVPEATSVSPTAQAQATIVFGSREQQLRVRGVEWESDRLFPESLVLTEGGWDAVAADRTIVLGAQSARRFGLGLGDSVFVKLSTISGQQNVTEYNLAAVYDDSAAGGMTTALVPLDNLLADLSLKAGEYQSLAIFLPDASAADERAKTLAEELTAAGYTASLGAGTRSAASSGSAAQTGTAQDSAVLRRAGESTSGAGQVAPRNQSSSGDPPSPPADSGAGFSGRMMQEGGGGMFGTPPTGFFGAAGGSATGTIYRISTITQLSGQMGTVLGSVRWIGITIFAIMLVLTAAGITNTYRMVLMERTKEIGMLRCIGFRRRDIFRIFIYEAILIAIGGSIAGILLSLPAGLLIHQIPMNPSGSLGSALARGHLLFSPDLLSSFFVIFAVAVASIIAVFGPARKAARLLPVEALRQTA